MSSVRKVVLIPHLDTKLNQTGGSNSENNEGVITTQVEIKKDKIKMKIYDKVHRFIKIIMRLAKNSGYDDDLHIKLRSGKYLERSNIVDLLTHAMSAGKVLYGENEFIDLLHFSGVDPDLIINDNVRIKLMQLHNSKKADTIPRVPVTNQDIRGQKRQASEMEESNNNTTKKRKIVEDEIRTYEKSDDINLGSSNKSNHMITDGEVDIADDMIDPNFWDTSS